MTCYILGPFSLSLSAVPFHAHLRFSARDVSLPCPSRCGTLVSNCPWLKNITGDIFGEIGPITAEDALSLSVGAVGPCAVLSFISLSTVFSSAPALAAKAAILPTSTFLVPAIGWPLAIRSRIDR
ncbi:hypothetical protein B0H12DRAFT_118817 [Mycena haematopus]|nr:hypothetical protein B0H12DRAFT_118817 [Mycena haematopus]